MSSSSFLRCMLMATIFIQIATMGCAASPAQPKNKRSAPDARIIASVVGRRRSAFERVMGKPISPATDRHSVIAHYRVQGCAIVTVQWRTTEADTDMVYMLIVLKPRPSTWQQTLRRVGYGSEGAYLVNSVIEEVPGFGPSYELSLGDTCLLITKRQVEGAPIVPESIKVVPEM